MRLLLIFKQVWLVNVLFKMFFVAVPEPDKPILINTKSLYIFSIYRLSMSLKLSLQADQDRAQSLEEQPTNSVGSDVSRPC